jgi:hypothetical protein
MGESTNQTPNPPAQIKSQAGDEQPPKAANPMASATPAAEGDPEHRNPTAIKNLGSALEESITDLSVKPIWKWFATKALTRGWATGAVLIGLAVYLTYSHMHSVSQQQLSEKEGEIKSITIDRDNARNELTTFKSESREINRQKDVDISKLHSEIDSLKQRVTYFETLPSGILSIVTNIASLQSNALANPMELERVLTNSFAGLVQPKAAFKFLVGNQTLTNHSIVLLDTNSNLRIGILNDGFATAGQIVVNLTVGLDSSNIIAGEWMPQPPLQLGDADYYRNSEFQTHSQVSFPRGAAFLCAPLQFVTNAPRKLTWINILANSETTSNYCLTLLLDLRNPDSVRYPKDIRTETFRVGDSKRASLVPYGTNNTYIIMFTLGTVPVPDSIMAWYPNYLLGNERLGLCFKTTGNLAFYCQAGCELSDLTNYIFTLDYITNPQTNNLGR